MEADQGYELHFWAGSQRRWRRLDDGSDTRWLVTCQAIPYATHETFFTVSLHCSPKHLWGDKSVLPLCGIQNLFWFYVGNWPFFGDLRLHKVRRLQLELFVTIFNHIFPQIIIFEMDSNDEIDDLIGVMFSQCMSSFRSRWGNSGCNPREKEEWSHFRKRRWEGRPPYEISCWGRVLVHPRTKDPFK